MTETPGDNGNEPSPPDDGGLEQWEEYGVGLFADEDEVLVELVADRLLADVQVRAQNMLVTVQNCVVILEGQVESPEAKEAAGRQAWATPGIHDVCNLLVHDVG
jgi:hypothetical protein